MFNFKKCEKFMCEFIYCFKKPVSIVVIDKRNVHDIRLSIELHFYRFIT